MTASDPGTDQLLTRAGAGDQRAIDQLLQRHRPRVRRMISLRMDSRLSARLDPSDVVQETFVEVAKRLAGYAKDPPLPFYPWLRKIAWERLVNLHEHHIQVQKRTITAEEEYAEMALPDESVMRLASQLSVSGTSPSRQLMKKEMRTQMRGALAQLPPHDREVLVLRYLEEMSLSETAAVLEISEGAVSMRQLRALLQLRKLLDDETDL